MKKKSILVLNIVLLVFSFYSNINAQIVAGGGTHTIAVCSNGTVTGVGYNVLGQLGNGQNTYNSYSVVTTYGLSNIVAISAGENHNLYLKSDGTVWAVGKNSYGQLGDGTFTNRNIAVQVIGLNGIIAISAGGNHSLFLKNDNTVWSVGRNSFGEQGDGTLNHKSIATQIPGLTGITKISAGGTFSLFLKNDNTVWAVGRNNFGQLGNGTTTQANTIPFQIPNLNGIIDLDAGGAFSVFLKNNDTVWATGENGYGQIGDGTFGTWRLVPTQMQGLSGVSTLKSGTHHTLFLKSDGTVWSVGHNTSGTLGDGTFIHKAIAGQVVGLTNVSSISAGGFHSIFTKTDGSVWVVGDASNGQLGDGTNIDKNIPFQSNFCNAALALSEIQSNNIASISPNPFSEFIDIELINSTEASIDVFNLHGQLIYSADLHGSKNTILTNSLNNGIYIVKIKTSDSMTIKKVVKN